MNELALVGSKFGRLEVIEFVEKRFNGYRMLSFYKCKCECGNYSIVSVSNLKSGNSKSCGCRKFNGYDGNATHGLSGTFEHRVWKGIRKRCYSPGSRIYKYYGGRGISMCERWFAFVAFLEDMGKAPSEDHSIERKDVNGNYCPSNCIWLPRKQQNQNRRDTIRIAFDGQCRTLRGWSEHLQIPLSTLVTRYHRGWETECLLTTPTDGSKFKRKSLAP